MHPLYAGRPGGHHQWTTTWRSVWKTQSTMGKIDHKTQRCWTPTPHPAERKWHAKSEFSSRNLKLSCSQKQEELEGESVGKGGGGGLSGYYLKGSVELSQVSPITHHKHVPSQSCQLWCVSAGCNTKRMGH